MMAACSTGGPTTPASTGQASTPSVTSEAPPNDSPTSAVPTASPAASSARATASPTGAKPTRAPSATRSPSPKPTPPKPVNANYRKFDPDNFVEPIGARNRWFPLVAGNQSLRDGSLMRGSRRLHHERRLTVTDVVKEINGVRTVLLLDQDIDAGQNGETAVDYLAQDKGGNIWYLGSYTEAYEGGEFVNARDAWLAGKRDASAGVLLLADPKEDMKYVEADIPGRETIRAQVAKVGERKCVPFRCFSKTLAVLEDGSEFKYYASGVGHIATEPNYEGGEQEKEELINVIQLTPKGLAEASKEALRLDRRAAKEAERIFGKSKPAKRV
jgi:hypothetical protein